LCVGSQYALPAADGSAGQIMCTDGSGALAFATASAGVTLAGSTNNTVATVTGSNALAGEANLTFDGSTLAVTGTTQLRGAQSGSDGSFANIDGYSTTDSSVLSRISFLRNGADNAGGISFHVDDSATLNQAMVIINDGKVGIGTAAPTTALTVLGEVLVKNDTHGADAILRFDAENDAGNLKAIEFDFDPDASLLKLTDTAGTDYFTISSSTGRIEGYSNPAGNSAMHLVQSHGSDAYGLNIDFSAYTPNNTSYWAYRFEDATALRYIVYSDGSVQGSANSYGAISDVRLKQDITDVRSYWDDFKDVRFRKYKLKTDVEQFGENAQSYFGVVAQEMESIFPALITESPDTKQQSVPVLDSDGNATYKLDDEGNPIPITESKIVNIGTTTKGFKYSILSQIGLKVIQELQTRLEAAEAEIAILKG
jgi:hypothetical protein